MRLRNFYRSVRLGVGLGCLVMLGVIPALAADIPTPPPSLAVLTPSSPSPAFELPHAQGTTMRSADLQGKVVVVRFWATW